MFSRDRIALNIISEYVKQYQESFAPDPLPQEAEQFLLVLRIREWQLKRALRSDSYKLEYLPTLRTGIRRAEDLLDGLSEDEQTLEVRNLASLLWMIAHELNTEVLEIEAEFPHLCSSFEKERHDYRRMKDEAEAAER